MRSMQSLTLVAATVTTGLIAGLFFAFACAVMPALRGTDDRSFVDVMQRINVTILNPVFVTTFMGGLVLTVAAGIVHWRDDGRSALPWILAGLALYAATFLITRGINVPLNDKLEAAGDPSGLGDPGAVRDRFEGTWVAWNIVRALTNIAAFGCLAYALFVHGRSTAPDAAPADPSPAVAVAYQLSLPQESLRHNDVFADGGAVGS